MSDRDAPARVLLVTGGSRGIGAATARLAGASGWAVCVNYRKDAAGAEEVTEEIRGRGGRAVAARADVSSEADVVRLFRVVEDELGPLRGLVNNAGTLERQSRVEELDADRIRRVLDTNVVGCILCAREAVRRMSTRRDGRGGAIVNVSSAASRTGSPGEYVDYAASKGAVDSFTLGLAREVASEGIRVNAVRPAFIRTDIHALGGERDRVERIGPALPMGRGGEPEEVARAILWLLSDEASYVTGSFVDLSGGV